MIAITGGGTGGHLVIAKALAKELNEQGIKVIFIGSTMGQDRAWFENSDKFSHKYFLQSTGVVNKRGFAKISALLNIVKLSFACKNILKSHKIKAVISVGGYSSAPASIASVIFGYKLFLHEQNAISGRLNSILKPFCKLFFSSYEAKSYPYPVLDKFFITRRLREKLNTIIFLGGSQGASYVNDLAIALAPNLSKLGIKIIHQCGSKDFERVKTAYENLNINANVFDFSNSIENFMNDADLCIGRAGASTLWELCANGLPTIFLPYPFAAKNHQFYNAKFLKDQDLCRIITQKDCNQDCLEILELIEKINIKDISFRLQNTIQPNGAKIIVDKILSTIKL